ncbi:MAG: hypothetical protein J0H82_04425 [Alphaproteobacteria bacterium]|jgi:hypothetical protein|nr:hypothetical protein [Alphaproteobacteria bacterium]
MQVVDQIQARADLEIIMAELARDPSSPVAVTEAADQVLHDALDAGTITVLHDPTAWGTDQYRAAWRRTVTAFARRGITLDADPAAPRADGRAGAMCYVAVKAAA